MRLAVVADIHGNLPALEAVLADQAERRVDRVVNLGDCVSGPLWPRETLALLRAKDWPTVRGNHDRVAGMATDPSGLGPSDRYAFEALPPTDRAWLADLPTALDGLLNDLGRASFLPSREKGSWPAAAHAADARIAAVEAGCTGRESSPPTQTRVLAVHARPDNDVAYLLEDQQGPRLVRADPATVRARLGRIDADLVLTAHSHLQRSLHLPDGPSIVNPGSVGCPAYDDDGTDPPHISEQGSPAARYAIIEPRPEGLLIELLSIPYDHRSAAARAGSNGRADWAHALATGFALRAGGPA